MDAWLLLHDSITSADSLMPIVIATAVLGLVLAISGWYLLAKRGPDYTLLALERATPINEPTAKIVTSLTAALPTESVYPRGHPDFLKSIRGFWSTFEQAVIPACVVKPQTTEQLSKAVATLSQGFTQSEPGTVQFAVSSGGHGPSAGLANAQGGVTIDMSAFRTFEVAPDRRSVTIGVGYRWIEVYKKLDALGLTVPCGRSGGVGVGGLVLGGGISFFYPRKGWTCDNIISYEIVLADGSIVTATEDSHPDLWWALKGGGNNFGILASCTVKCFDLGKIWAGYVFYPASRATELAKAFYEFAQPDNYDEYAACIISMGYDYKWKTTAFGVSIAYTKPEKNPPVLQPFMKLKRMWSTVKVQHMASAAKEMAGFSPPNYRQAMETTTFENDLPAIQACLEYFQKSVDAIRHSKNIVWSIGIQPLPPTANAVSGINALGIPRNREKTLIVVLICVQWADPNDDELIWNKAIEVIQQIEAFAKQRKVFNRFKYMNYAGGAQDVITGYGEETREKLCEISAKYDPNGLFQRGFTGGFKLRGQGYPTGNGHVNGHQKSHANGHAKSAVRKR